jgi:hypothetical protein
VQLGRCRADIIFKDKYDRTIIIEVKRGILSRDASGQILEYYGLLKQENPETIIELILCANVIPPERKIFLENVGIECKELGVGLIAKIAKKYSYKFLDEPEERQLLDEPEERQFVDEETKRVWIFQANPKRYDILNALADSSVDKETWLVNQHKHDIRNGHTALIWMSGKDAGIYAVAKITSDPALMYDSPATEKYWIKEKDKRRHELRVSLKVTKSLLNRPLFRSELKNIEALKDLSILKFSQGTNFSVEHHEWKIIKKQIKK